MTYQIHGKKLGQLHFIKKVKKSSEQLLCIAVAIRLSRLYGEAFQYLVKNEYRRLDHSYIVDLVKAYENIL